MRKCESNGKKWRNIWTFGDIKYNVKKTDSLYARLEKLNDGVVLGRSVRGLAVDWNLCKELQQKGLKLMMI